MAEFLRENLPLALGVGTGELFSFNSPEVSPQCDVVVYDCMRTPIFGRETAVQQIPIEGAYEYVVIEVRSIIDAKALSDAAVKFMAIRKLWIASCENGSGNKLDDCPSFILFGFKRVASESACLAFLKRNKEEDCSIVSLDSGCSMWVGPEDRSAPAKPHWLETTIDLLWSPLLLE